MTELLGPDELTRQFADEYGVDLSIGMPRTGSFLPRVVELDPVNGSLLHITEDTPRGADYYLMRVDYTSANDPETRGVVASRSVAVVMQGRRTNLAYWPKVADPKILTVHRGIGYLIVNTPNEANPDDSWNTQTFRLDTSVTPTITLPPGSFYAVEAITSSPTHLVVSGLSIRDSGKWGPQEILVPPGATTIQDSEKEIIVPDEFVVGNFN